MPYKMNIGLMLIFMILFSSVRVNAAAMGIIIAYAAILSSYPFSIGESKHLDMLYASLPVNRSEAVMGRYAYALLIQILLPVIQLISRCAFDLAASGFIWLTFMDIVSAVISIVISSIIVFCQFPILFKMGYNKSKAMSYFPVIVIIAGTVLGGGALERLGLMDSVVRFVNSLNIALIGAAVAIVYAVVLVTSYRLSVRFYSQRNL
jgi:hypothetical protein